ncbi:MAG: hypothetical protein K0S09_3082 [Sphingobacteriaceae bacterium]|jgi:gliding motility-associated-like protein|nr:hypothetical protein [Sphingobacteriaceae bacterium]
MFYKRVLLAVLCCVFSFYTSRTSAQGTSNKGTDFWVAYTGHIDGTGSRLTLFVTSTFNTVVTVDAGGTVLPPINVTANQAVPVYIDPTVYTNTYISGSDAPPAKKGIHIASTQPIVVYSHISRSARSAATLVLPTKALGNEYYAIAYTQTPNNYSEFTLVGVEDATVVEITPKVNSLNSTRLANVPYQITLNKGEVYQFQSTSDVTGSKIKTIGTCKPVAAFSGSSFVYFCEPGNTKTPGSGDNLYQQLFPLSSWGKNFVTAPFYNAQIGSSDIIRIQVSANNTTLKVNGSATVYQAGAVITFASKTPNVIEADQPIAVSQYQVTVGCSTSTSIGDPEMTILNPIEQTLTDITLYSAISTTAAPTNISKHYLNIILKTADISSLRVDGVVPMGTFRAIDSQYSYITVDVTTSSITVNPAHRIVCNNGFTAIAYGYGQTESYAYLAGADLKNLNANVQIYEPGKTSSTSSLCSGESYQVKLQLPYQTSKIVWELKLGSTVIKTETLNPTAPDNTTTVNGQPAYFYEYNNILASDISTPGIYDLKATVTNPAPTSCSVDEDISTSFQVFAIPSPSFTASTQQPCIASQVTLTSTSNDGGNTIVKWYWDYGDGNTEVRTDGTPFTHAYAQPGDYNVTLMVEGASGCQSALTSPLTIHVNKSPDAQFSYQAITCKDQPTAFTDASVANEGTIAKWTWDFGDANATASNPNTSTDQNPTHIYTLPGTYTVKLFVETDKGCTSTVVSQSIIIHELPVADFDLPAICLNNGTASFTNKSTIADGTTSQLTYLWDFGDQFATTQNPNTSTQLSPSHTYSKAGTYTIALIAKSVNGCQTLASKQFTISGSTPLVVFNTLNSAKLCSDQPVVFEDKSTLAFGEITRIDWYYDYANNPTTFETDNSPALRAATAKQYSHTYPTFTAPLTKSYTVRMLAYSGADCVDDEIKTIILQAVPVADFSMPDFCLSDGAAPFTNKSSIANGTTGMTYLWDFGDQFANAQRPNTSTSANPSHAYTRVGVYTVTLTATSAAGCSNTITRQFTVNGSTPKAAFNVLNPAALCSNQPVQFEDKGTVDFGEITRIDWYYDFGNNPTLKETDNSPALRGGAARIYPHTYSAFSTPLTKTYTVKMVAFSGSGSSTSCVNEVTQTITVKAVPAPDFTLPDACLPNGEAQFTDKTTIAPSGEPFTYVWDFGDANANAQHPNTSTDKNPVHAYSAPGTYQVRLTATSADGCQETIVKPFTISASIPNPEFNVINAAQLCSNQPVVIEDKATIAFGEITRIDWYYDFANNPTAVETDNSPAQRAATAKAYSHIYPTFTNPLTKTYTVKMVAYSGNTCVAEISKDITLKSIPSVDFDIPDVCLVDGIAQFKDKSSIAAGGTPFTYLWDFGDRNANSSHPNTSTDQDASHTFAASGAYQISLTVTAANGCSATLVKPLTILGSIPKADFNVLSANQLCSDEPVIFEDKATLAFGEITKIEWYFDNSNYPSDPSYIQTDNTPNLRAGTVKQYSFSYPAFHSPMTKTVNVRMKAYSGQVCAGEVTKIITLKAVPLVVFNPIPGICEELDAIQLTEASETTSFPGSGIYSGDGVSSSGIFDPEIAGVGTHTITYTFTGSNGCVNSQSQDVSVYKTPTVNAGTDQVILLGGQFTLSPTTTGDNLTYKWSPATGLTRDDVANPIAKPDDDITYSVTITTGEGCTATDDIFIKVLKSPEVPNTFTPNNDGVNDTWNIKYLESYPGATVDIFNRYGTKVYTNITGYSQPWDGTVNGEALPAGTYYYIINPKNGKKIMSGQLTIIR